MVLKIRTVTANTTYSLSQDHGIPDQQLEPGWLGERVCYLKSMGVSQLCPYLMSGLSEKSLFKVLLDNDSLCSEKILEYQI